MSKEKNNLTETTLPAELLAADRLAYVISLIGIVLLPLFIVPWLSVPLIIGKIFWALIITLLVFIFWLIGRLQTGTLSMPKNPALLGGLAVIMVFFIASLSADNISHSLIGSGFDQNSTATISGLFLLLFILSIIFDRRERVLNFYLWLFAGSFLIGLYSLFKIVSTAYFPLSALAFLPANLIGSWYEVGIFFGFTGLASLIVLELFPVSESRWFKYFLTMVFVFSLIMMALVNFYPTWIIFGLAALLLFVYVSTIGGPEKILVESKLKPQSPIKIARPAFMALLISLFLIVLGSQTSLVGNLINQVYQRFDFAFVDIRPSWVATGQVVRGVFDDHVLLGLGPNNFNLAWSFYKPDQFNELPYWNISFESGVGILPSYAATAGILGVLAWLFFLGGLLYFGLKGIFNKNQNSFSRLLTFLLFSGALYLWIFTLIYPVSASLFILAFIISGLLIGQMSGGGVTKHFNFSLTTDPRVNFVSVLVIVVLIMASITGIYLIFQKYWAAGIFFTSLNDESKTPAETEKSLIRVINLNHRHDLYFRTLAQINQLLLVNLLQTENLPQDELRQRFQTTLIQAVNNAQVAVNLNNQQPDNWLTLGSIYELLVPLGITGAAEQATMAYERSLILSPKNPAILANLARLSFITDDVDTARNYLNRALALKSNYTTALFMLAQIDLAAGRNQEALNYAERAVLLAPNDFGAHFQLGFLKYRLGDFSGAVESLERSLALSPNNINANTQYFLGLSYAELGRRAEAISQFEIIEKFNQANQEVKQILANLNAGQPALAGLSSPSPVEAIEPPIDETTQEIN